MGFMVTHRGGERDEPLRNFPHLRMDLLDTIHMMEVPSARGTLRVEVPGVLGFYGFGVSRIFGWSMIEF